MNKSISQRIADMDVESYASYKDCVKAIAEITLYYEYDIPFIWNSMLETVLLAYKIKVTYSTKQAISNWIDAAMMWNAELYAPVARSGDYPFPVGGDYYDFAFSRRYNYFKGTPTEVRRYVQTIALFERLRYYYNEASNGSKQDYMVEEKGNYFEETDMWTIIQGDLNPEIDWDYYDVHFHENTATLNKKPNLIIRRDFDDIFCPRLHLQHFQFTTQ